jgi:5-hydroxyisourate hydrolase
MSPITTHALDTRLGRPASNLPISLSRRETSGWVELAAGITNADGRITNLLNPGELSPGIYQMRFDTGAYHHALDVDGFYPEALITFEVKRVDEHYHIPLLLSPFGYSTYRGS